MSPLIIDTIPEKMKVKTTVSAKASDFKRNWYLINAEGKVLGRLATRVARILTGKDKPVYTPHVDCGDHVIIINADKVRVTGASKPADKTYFTHTGYQGHLKSTSLAKLMSEKPERVVIRAVHGMVPKTKLGKVIMSKLKVYRGSGHPHVGQKPVVIE